jgi:hypothetical protein
MNSPKPELPDTAKRNVEFVLVHGIFMFFKGMISLAILAWGNPAFFMFAIFVIKDSQLHCTKKTSVVSSNAIPCFLTWL